MRNLPEFPARYFEEFSTAPVPFKPYAPDSRRVASIYLERLRNLLRDTHVEIRLRGSTAFEIAGKGDIEFGVYPTAEDWGRVVEILESICGKAQNTEDGYVRLNDTAEGYEIEVIVLAGYAARIDIRLTEYLLEHRGLLTQYERLKERHAYSKRAYQQEKDRFFRTIVAMIPED